MNLPDIQDQPDTRGIPIDRVGVTGVRYPIRFDDGDHTHTGIAIFDLTVELPADRRGTHMSRMIELIHDYADDLDPRTLPTFLKTAAHRLDVESVQLDVTIPMAFEVTAPISSRPSWQPLDSELTATRTPNGTTLSTTVTTDVTSVCPCSKAISDYGAHNQRSSVTLTLIGCDDTPYPLPVTEAAHLIRSIGSASVYPLIKRADERAVTMTGHDRPQFVEDMARDLSQACRRRGVPHSLLIRNLESIHSHDAVAAVSWLWPSQGTSCGSGYSSSR